MQRTGYKFYALLSNLLYTNGGINLNKHLFDGCRNIYRRITLLKIYL